MNAPRLKWKSPDGKSQEYLVAGPEVIIGRGGGTDLPLPSLHVSRRHARSSIVSRHQRTQTNSAKPPKIHHSTAYRKLRSAVNPETSGTARGDVTTVTVIERGAYHDSVVLLGLARELREAEGVLAAAALMGTPANRELLRGTLRERWGWQGLLVSDWGSIGEMVAHGFVPDLAGAAGAALTAGSDMDMESGAYVAHLAALVPALLFWTAWRSPQ